MKVGREFSDLADMLPEPTLLVTSDGRLAFANKAAAALFKLASAHLVGELLSRFVVESEAAIADLLKAGSRTSSPVPCSLTVAQQQGAMVRCRCECAIYRPRSPDSPALILLRLTRKEVASSQFLLLKQRIEALSKEIARRRYAEAALRETTARYRVTLESIGDAVIATDASGRITFMNAVAERLTGWPLADGRGLHLDRVFVIVNEATREVVESPVAKVLRIGGVVGLANPTILIKADGSELAIDDSGAPIRDDHGAIIGVVLVFRDLSERHAFEHELLEKTRLLQETERRKDVFLSMLAHELRNPLAPLSSGVRLLEKRYPEVPGLPALAQMMERQVAHMVRLVDDLLDVARLTKGRIDLRKHQVEINEVFSRAVELTRPLFEARALRLVVTPTPTAAIVEADLTRLVQVFANLLSNAAKFSADGGVVHMGSRFEGHQVVAFVRDSGLGIDPELLPHVFELFVQGDQSLDRSRSGLGIGLTIARSVLDLHQGSIEARSDGLGRGSEFVVRLPLAEDAKAGSIQTVPLPPSDVRSSALKVLIVDDNKDAAETLASVVCDWGHVTQIAYEPKAALDFIRQGDPDTVLLDIGLPGMNGYELARAIRALPEGRPRSLIAVTGYGDAQAKAQSREAGIDHHLTKPVELEALRAILSTIASQ